MRHAVLTILCLLPGTVGAHSTECQTIAPAADRLACYDKAAPPTAMQKPAKPGAQDRAAQKASQDGKDTPLADMLAVENSKLSAKIKNICRGC